MLVGWAVGVVGLLPERRGWAVMQSPLVQEEAQEQAARIRQLQGASAPAPPQRGVPQAALPELLGGADGAPSASGGWVASFDSSNNAAPAPSAGGPQRQAADVAAGAFDPFCIGDAGAGLKREGGHAAHAPVAEAASPPAPPLRHRRTSSEPTALDSWGTEFKV